MVLGKKYLLCLYLSLGFLDVITVELRSYISGHGLHGTISFTYIAARKSIKIVANLDTTLQYPEQAWSWFVTEFPVDYTQMENRCSKDNIGETIISMDDVFGYLILPDNKTAEYETKDLEISGEKGIYGKSLLFSNLQVNMRICASIIMIDKNIEKVAVAKFNSPIEGTVYFRWFFTKTNDRQMLISTDLHRVTEVEKLDKHDNFTEHHWKIYVTDILDHSDGSDKNCNILQLIFNPENVESTKALGAIDARLGKVKVASYTKNRVKTLFVDEQLILLPSDLIGPQRRLYLVLFENAYPDSFLACAKIRYEQPLTAKVLIQFGGIVGDITLTQHSRLEPSFLRFNLTTAKGNLETRLVYSSSVARYMIHELPISPSKLIEGNENQCLTTKFVFNPLKTDIGVIPNGLGTQDQYAIGDLSGKLLGRNNITPLIDGQELSGLYWDTYLPLQGRYSVMHRALVIYKNTLHPLSELKIEPWICGTVTPYDQNFKYQKQIFTAQALFRYPVVGRVLFRQIANQPWSDTSIFIDYIVHADGSNLNNSVEHRWAVHNFPPGQDFYSWQNRCLSTGDIYNPHQINITKTDSFQYCHFDKIGLCRIGDLSTRHGTLKISGKKSESDMISRKYLVDSTLPLTGINSILGKSLVIYDDHGPKARGERLACAKIQGIYKRKAVARDWFPNGEEAAVKGKIEFYQQTEYDITNVEVNLESLKDNGEYHVNMVSIEENLQFPCESTSLYGNWNPINIDPATSPRKYHGTPDMYEIGDLSGKFGTLDNRTMYKMDYNDSTLPLFGPRSIIGRSVVIHKKNNVRWSCSTIERGYSPSEARELRAIASFHHPAGYAYGYMKMSQLIYNDESMSDTIIEIKLRHPGKFDRNVTRDHHFAVYVNPVGVDAAVKTQDTRCVAGGYVWNPYYTQLADPLNNDLYRQECGPANPLRCYVGDLSARLGTIDLGLRRKIVVDSNLPLEGPVTAIGRSIVIMSPNKQPQRFACANIEPDYDIIKYTNIEKPPRFVLAQFIEDVREVMGIPEWMLTVDSRKIKILHNNACIQFLMHFKGPNANRLEQDFGRLISTGRLDAPSLYIPGYVNQKRMIKIPYKQCGMRDPNDKRSTKSSCSCTNFHPMSHFLMLSHILIVLKSNFR